MSPAPQDPLPPPPRQGAGHLLPQPAERAPDPGPVHGIVPPHLLRRIADGPTGQSADAARRTLALGARTTATREVRAARTGRTDAPTGTRPQSSPDAPSASAGLLPPHIAQRLPRPDPAARPAVPDGRAAAAGTTPATAPGAATSAVPEAGLIYLAQPGALHESIADCFGAMTAQHQRGQRAEEADWLIGAGLFTDAVQGVALRSMKAPGTAYDDPVLGKDPQPDSMAHYADLPHDAENDNGGVHINSGIPNRAFYLAATGIGGRTEEGAGLLWYDALTRGGLPRDADFATFAAATLAAAEARHGADSAERAAVAEAWRTVGVLEGEA